MQSRENEIIKNDRILLAIYQVDTEGVEIFSSKGYTARSTEGCTVPYTWGGTVRLSVSKSGFTVRVCEATALFGMTYKFRRPDKQN